MSTPVQHPGGPSAPAHRRPELLVLVLVGGALGTAGRDAAAHLLPTGPGGFPTATLAVNVLGSFALGLLLETLLRRGAETPRATAVRLGLGTGVLGGFTTYSSLALEVDQLTGAGSVGTGAFYAVVSLVGGLFAALAGLAVAGARTRRGEGT